MTNITIPIHKEYLKTIDSLVKNGDFDNRSQFIRAAIKKMIENKEIEEIKEASQRAKMGEVFEGELNDLVAKYA